MTAQYQAAIFLLFIIIGKSSAVIELSKNAGLFGAIAFPYDQTEVENNLLKSALSALQIDQSAATDMPNETIENSHMSEGTKTLYECGCDCGEECECTDKCTVQITKYPQVNSATET